MPPAKLGDRGGMETGQLGLNRGHVTNAAQHRRSLSRNGSA
jgi:hypothetical protein